MNAGIDYAFLHGGGQGGWVWEQTVAALTSQTNGTFGRALTLDIPGCGAKRGRVTDALGIDDIAAELIGDIEAAGLRDVVLVGHSQAGTILPRLVRRRADLFRHVVYVSCLVPLAGQTTLSMMGSGLHGQHPQEVGWPVDPATHSINERYAAMFCNDMSALETSRFLARLGSDTWPASTYAASDWLYDGLASVPSSYVVCWQDGILPAAWQERFAERVGASRLVRIDAGHQVMNTRPHALAEVLRALAAVPMT
jgi:pimeloyl-ACP methyl ester carboxylesterase